MTSASRQPEPSRPRHHGVRLTRRVFWDLGIWMIGLGVLVGVVFPLFAMLLGVPAGTATRPSFVAACVFAGFVVAALSHTLCRAVVGRRLVLLSRRLHEVAGTVTLASRTGDWTGSGRIPVDSDDELGATAAAFNELLEALEAGEHFRSLVRNASDVITVVSLDGEVTYQTPSVGWVLGYPPNTLVGTDVHTLMHPEDVDAFRYHLADVVAGSVSCPSVVSRIRHRSGAWRWVETSASDLLDDPAVRGVVLTSRDVGDRKALEDRLRVQAFEDTLTGLPNRALFMERLRTAEEARAAEGTPLAVMFLDLDNLKTVNDNLGHEVGDTLLQVVTSRIAGCLRPQDVLARLAGDEFAVLVTGVDSGEHAERTAERVLALLREPMRLAGRDVSTGASIGVATSETCPEGLGLLRAADVAMYVAKAEGKGRCEVFRASHHAAQLDGERLRADLHLALDERQLELYYQPIVDLASQRATGFEALLRWNHPERGLVPPSTFIPLAEESGLIVPIGRWVVQEAARQAATWQAEQQRPDLRVSVNVSARQFHHPGLVEDVAQALHASGLEPSCLTLEITETLLLQDAVDPTRRLAELKDLGVRLALDDFGTGYSSLSYLRRFPIDILKVDKSFVDGIPGSSADCAVVGAVVQLAQTLELEVVAEGLETLAQVDALARLSCPSGQGYHFARPLPAREAAAWLRSTGCPAGTAPRSPSGAMTTAPSGASDHLGALAARGRHAITLLAG